MKFTFVILILLFSCCFACSGDDKDELKSQNRTIHNISGNYTVEVAARDLYVPWSIAFIDSLRILVTERNGRLRIIKNGILIEKPLHDFNDVISIGEGGLMGLALDPDYTANDVIFLSYTYEFDDDLYVKVVRFKDNGDFLSDEKIILDRIPTGRNHAGCRLRFGPDKKLYITTGDATDRERAQELDRLEGKILRLNNDGTVPVDNPFPGSSIWSYGHRNPQGIDWYPRTDILFSTEHGPSGFDGPGGGDEVNIIYKGRNYGWPVVHHEERKDGMEDPVLVYTPAVAPASGMFYKSGRISYFKNNFLFGCLRGEGIMRVVVDENDPTRIISHEILKDVNYGRIREIAESPDGSIYFSTSNRDGRGREREGDDKIYRITGK